LPSLLPALRSSYASASPYCHGRITNLFSPGHLNNVLSEVTTNVKATYKESDLFRFYQSLDLSNLQPSDELYAKLPSLIELRTALYSPPFLAYMESACSLPPNTLTGKTDCAINVHTKNCHLLCHDDVIGTRKISFIVYLTDPDLEWTKENGGQLELYPSIPASSTSSTSTTSTSSIPSPIPSKTILPIFNTCAFFEVVPNKSFHSVQEVFTDTPRMSIQGWYHAKTPPEDWEDGTLGKLKREGKGEDVGGNFEPVDADASNASTSDTPPPPPLTKSEISFLSSYINKEYLTTDAIQSINSRFETDSSVQLRSFLLPEIATPIQANLKKSDEALLLGSGKPPSSYTVGEGDGWKVAGPTHKQRFLEYNPSANNTGSDLALGEKLKDVESFLRTDTYRKYVALLTSLTPKSQRSKIKRYRPGLDYSVANYGGFTTKDTLDCTLVFCDGDGKQCLYDEQFGDLNGNGSDELWESGECGGFEVYIAADEEEDGEAVDEYNADDDTELLSVRAAFNTVTLGYRNYGVMKFRKYVNCDAPGSVVDVGIEWEVDGGESDDEEEGGTGDEEGGDDTADAGERKE
jgi:Rps23 Pro-64 3,4-dihydroxylase Tpa1-like proline 4-hydroxylase